MTELKVLESGLNTKGIIILHDIKPDMTVKELCAMVCFNKEDSVNMTLLPEELFGTHKMVIAFDTKKL
jgi:hypothetical protein